MEPINESTVIVSVKKTGVAVVALNRPKKRNALSQELIDELTGALRKLNGSPTVRVVVLSGSGASPFCGKLIYHTSVSHPRLTLDTSWSRLE